MSATQTSTDTLKTTLSGAKYNTAVVENHEFVPPKDFVLPDNLVSVPINPKGPTEVPVKTYFDYSKPENEVRCRSMPF
jgi:hypothetical protein